MAEASLDPVGGDEDGVEDPKFPQRRSWIGRSLATQISQWCKAPSQPLKATRNLAVVTAEGGGGGGTGAG